MHENPINNERKEQLFYYVNCIILDLFVCILNFYVVFVVVFVKDAMINKYFGDCSYRMAMLEGNLQLAYVFLAEILKPIYCISCHKHRSRRWDINVKNHDITSSLVTRQIKINVLRGFSSRLRRRDPFLQTNSITCCNSTLVIKLSVFSRKCIERLYVLIYFLLLFFYTVKFYMFKVILYFFCNNKVDINIL